MMDEFEFYTVTNASNYDFTDSSEIKLLWNKQPFQLKVGESKPLNKGLAEHFAKKIVDRMIIESERGIKDINDADIRKECLSRVLNATATKDPKEELGMAELRKMASEKGIAYKPTTKKVELLEMLAAVA
jgi:hypothetical protein